ISLSQSGVTYTAAINNVTGDGHTIQASVPVNSAQDDAGNENTTSASTDNIVVLDNIAPSVTINQSVGQPDPTQVQPLNFTIVFSEPVAGLTDTDISLSGSTANVSSAIKTITGSGPVYNVAVSNITSNGLVRA